MITRVCSHKNEPWDDPRSTWVCHQAWLAEKSPTNGGIFRWENQWKSSALWAIFHSKLSNCHRVTSNMSLFHGDDSLDVIWFDIASGFEKVAHNIQRVQLQSKSQHGYMALYGYAIYIYWPWIFDFSLEISTLVLRPMYELADFGDPWEYWHGSPAREFLHQPILNQQQLTFYKFRKISPMTIYIYMHIIYAYIIIYI